MLIASSSIFNILGKKKTQKALLSSIRLLCAGIMAANGMPWFSPECTGHPKDYFEVLRMEDITDASSDGSREWLGARSR